MGMRELALDHLPVASFGRDYKELMQLMKEERKQAKLVMQAKQMIQTSQAKQAKTRKTDELRVCSPGRRRYIQLGRTGEEAGAIAGRARRSAGSQIFARVPGRHITGV